MEKYTKINTMYRRYQFKPEDCPNKKWLKMRNKIILGEFSNTATKYLFNNLWEAYAKIDGTNCKIAFFPSTGEIRVEGKDEKSNDQQGMFAFLTEIGERIRPTLVELFPKESAKFAPVTDKDTRKIVYHDDSNIIVPTQPGMYKVILEEVPVYIYGEYFGKGIQKCGKRYLADSNDFLVFDIKQQGWWTPKYVRDELCEKLGLRQVPYVGCMTLKKIEDMVREGFTTTYSNASDPSLIEEGLVCRPMIPMFESPTSRVIVKVKNCDYVEYDNVLKEFTEEEFKEFNEWYKNYEMSKNNG